MLPVGVCDGWVEVVAQKHAVYREIYNGMGGVWQEVRMEMNRNMAKVLAYLLMQQLT